VNAEPTPRTRCRRKEARPAEILDAALHVFSARGFAAARLEDIAARAGVTKGTIYLYYPDKEALFEAVVHATLVPLLEEGAAFVRDFDGSSADLLRLTVHGWWETISRRGLGGLPKLVMTEAANFPQLAGFYYDNVVARGRRVLTSVLERGIERGEFRRVDTATFVHFILGPMVYAKLSDLSFGVVRPEARVLDEHYLDALADHVIHSLTPR
jgi:AcrR family transcriptional regulator